MYFLSTYDASLIRQLVQEGVEQAYNKIRKEEEWRNLSEESKQAHREKHEKVCKKLQEQMDECLREKKEYEELSKKNIFERRKYKDLIAKCSLEYDLLYRNYWENWREANRH